jgi:hypothetical protein
MNQYQQTYPQRSRSTSGCGKIAMIGGGCVVIMVIAFIGLLVAGGLLWDRGSEAGGNFVSNWISDRYGSDISDRADAIDDVTANLPEARDFDNQEDYLNFLESYNREFARAMQETADLLSRPQLQNDAWLDDVARQIAIVRQLESEARSVTPPAELQPAHDHWVDGMSEYRSAVDSAASALDNLSPSQLMESITSLNNATQSYIQMGRTLDDMGLLEDLQTMEQLREIDQD